MAGKSDRQFFREFILMYKCFPCLWDIASKAYMDRTEKKKAYDQLVLKYKEIDKNATRDTVIKKINALRTCYRRELAKISKSQGTGANEEDVHKPTLWYFSLFTFLDEGKAQDVELTYQNSDTSAAAQGSTTEEIVEHVEIEYIDDETNLSSKECAITTVEERLHSPCSVASSIVAESSSGKRKYTSIDQSADKRIRGSSVNNNMQFHPNREDASDVFGKHIAHKLHSLSKQQNILAQKLINDVLFEGEMETLNRYCRIVNSNDRQNRLLWKKSMNHET